MFINFEDADLIAFFNNLPIAIGDDEAGQFIFTAGNDIGFSICFSVDVYGQIVSIETSFKNSTVFKSVFCGVNSITKSSDDRELHVHTSTSRIIVMRSIFGVIIEDTQNARLSV